MAKITIPDINADYAATSSINDAFDQIETAIENTLSRDGTTPNNMAATLDMSSNAINNLGAPLSPTSAARLSDVTTTGNVEIGRTIYTSIASLRLSDPTQEQNVLLSGYYVEGDGGGGDFYWDSSSTETDDNGTIIKVTAITTGRWKRSYSGAVNVKWFGVTGDGVTDDIASLALAVAAMPSSGGILFFPKGDYYGNSTSPVVTITDISSITLQGEGQTATSIRQGGAGNGMNLIGTSELVNFKVKDMEVRGSAGAGKGIYIQNAKDGDIESVDVYNFKDHGIEFVGGGTLNNTVRRCRIGSALNANAETALIKATSGNALKLQDNYLNGVGNPNDGGTGAKYGIYVDSVNMVTLISNIYDGLQYAVRTNSVTIAINEYLDLSSPAPYRLDNGYYITANNAITVISSNRSDSIETIIYNPSHAVSDKYINFIGHNDGNHGGSIAGTLIAANVSPSQITANQNDYEPTDGRYSLHWRLTSDAERTITGIGSRSNGHCLILTNAGSFPIILERNSSLSSVANRILTGKQECDYTLGVNMSVLLIYDTTSQKWRTTGTQRKTVDAGVTANISSAQGPSTVSDVIEISTCATAGDAITLIPATAGLEKIVINNGANSADIFPASGDAINGGAVDAAVALAAGATIRFVAIDSTNWYAV